jgi:hypothetical protein
MGWYWEKGKPILITPEISSEKLALTERYAIDQDIIVPRLSPYSNYLTLGVYVSPCGSSDPACQILIKKPKIMPIISPAHIFPETKHYDLSSYTLSLEYVFLYQY